jgi:hypothetical protein
VIRLCLVIRCDLEGERLAVPERRAAVESETGTAEDGELDCYDIAGFAAGSAGALWTAVTSLFGKVAA